MQRPGRREIHEAGTVRHHLVARGVTPALAPRLRGHTPEPCLVPGASYPGPERSRFRAASGHCVTFSSQKGVLWTEPWPPNQCVEALTPDMTVWTDGL